MAFIHSPARDARSERGLDHMEWAQEPPSGLAGIRRSPVDVVALDQFPLNRSVRGATPPHP